jgi:mannitol-1-phosphate 5-dehydrogenase
VVARREGDPALDDPLVFVGDRPATFYVDAAALGAPLPAIEGMVITDRFEAAVQRKLFTFSAGHATAAYLGYLKGYHYVHTAVRDPEIRAAVLAAMAEGQKALLARYGPDVAGDERTLQEILSRFDNAALNDSIERVGRDPVRKLAKEDRLVGPARLAREAGVIPEKLTLAVAAAMLFCPFADRAAVELNRAIRCDGPTAVLCRVAGFRPDDTLAESAVCAYRRLAKERPERSQLLSFDHLLWA